ncbi:poly-gamma-glutamate synthesis protein (capsule biosynthesis protein) [Pseudobutyrivibrio sp. JW11]|uniref:CapA family protein n=1 Tax=Pseudobutyrivibrio sp. JW11 TaxID=1855302 RepID=UPI0008E2DC8E|nr:CapA family protein [Pseudobutyrivibrio sp. JW11]SFO64212.1 poly-gamma-glutamate synthesis protein (capsule biosynthesis protein) [Pseudobutyrivibrio sp. JW11]
MKRRIALSICLALSLVACGKQTVMQEQVSAQEANYSQPQPVESTTEDNGEYDFTLCFAGDINFDENWATTQYLNTCENGIADCISPELISTMQQADIMWINNEFTYSDRGQPLPGKAYTFRADPARVENLKLLGVDIVGLANNHVYDYGKDALLDTMDTLDAAGIPYVGAGHNLAEASEPVYMEVQGKKIAFVAASRAEKNKMTPQATDTEPGILRCYDTALFDEEIKEADANADIVVALPHWGTEYSTVLEPVQTSTAHEYIDAGADVIIGAHTHCLQGFEFYNDVPIVYSLGNYWFNEKTLDTMLITLHCYGDNDEENMDVIITPALQANCTTQYVADGAKQRQLYDRLESISVNAQISDDGIITQEETE